MPRLPVATLLATALACAALPAFAAPEVSAALTQKLVIKPTDPGKRRTDYIERKAANAERWLTGMRRLRDRIYGGQGSTGDRRP